MRWCGVLAGLVLLTMSDPGPCAAAQGPDPVVERIREHGGSAGSPMVVVVGPEDVPKSVWQSVKDLVAYRVHRPSEDGVPVTDAAIYLVRTSDLYQRAATVLRTNATGQDEVWCFLSAVLSHEAAHSAINTEQQALEAEAEQLRRCLFASHPPGGDVGRLASYISKVEAKLQKHDRR